MPGPHDKDGEASALALRRLSNLLLARGDEALLAFARRYVSRRSNLTLRQLRAAQAILDHVATALDHHEDSARWNALEALEAALAEPGRPTALPPGGAPPPVSPRRPSVADVLELRDAVEPPSPDDEDVDRPTDVIAQPKSWRLQEADRWLAAKDEGTADLPPESLPVNLLLGLEHYASLLARCIVWPDQSDAIYASFGVHDEADRRKLEAAWDLAFEENPTLEACCDALIHAYCAWLRDPPPQG